MKRGNRDGDLTPDVRSETRAPSRRPQHGQGAMGTEGSQERSGGGCGDQGAEVEVAWEERMRWRLG